MADIDEDEDFGFIPSGRSKLFNLFPSQGGSQEDVNQSLTYVPPKQPKKTDAQQMSNKKMKLLLAIATHTYKLENGQYESQGVLGSAILANHETSTYKLLLYKGKQQHVTWSTVNSSFAFHIDANNYAKFNDDKDEKWSIMFNGEAALVDFAKQVAIAKANSCGENLTTLIIQDLIPGEGPGLENGDSAEINYTGWLLTNNSFGKVFDSNLNSEKNFRLRLGKTKVIKGWNQGLLGAKKGTRRLLIIPPSLAYGVEGMGNTVPPNSILIFEIIVNKIKYSRDASHSPSPGKITSEKPEVPSRTRSLSNDESIRMRGASLSEQIGQSPQKDKAKIISRMAKMGMATLPMQGAVSAQNSDESEPEREFESDQQSLPQMKGNTSSPQHFHSQAQVSYPKEIENDECNVVQNSVSSTRTSSPQLQANIPQSPVMQNYQAAQPIPGGSFPFLQQAYPTQSMSSIMPSMLTSVVEAQLPLLIAETRSQSTDTRLSLSKICDKVDSVLHKLDDVRLHQGNQPLHGHMPYMESAILAHNIERIVQENLRLKQEMEVKSSKIQELNEKICDILQKNQRFFEESNTMLEQRSDCMQMTATQLHSKLMTLEQEKAQLSSDLAQSLSNFNSVQSKLEEYKRLENEHLQELQDSETKKIQDEKVLSSLKDQCAEKEALISLLRKKLDETEQNNKELIQRLKSAEEKLDSIEKRKKTMEEVDTFEKEKAAHLEEVKRLEEKLQNALMWKKKYEIFLQNTHILKRKYEDQISQLVVQLKQIQSSKTSVEPSDEFAAEIKRAMNALYKSMQSKLEATKTYSGAEALQISLAMIRRVTLSLVETNKKTPDIRKNDENISAESKVLSSGDQPEVSRKLSTTEMSVTNVSNSAPDDVPTTDGESSSQTVECATSEIVEIGENNSEASVHSSDAEQKPEEDSHTVQEQEQELKTVSENSEKDEIPNEAPTSNNHANEIDIKENCESAEKSSVIQQKTESREHLNHGGGNVLDHMQSSHISDLPSQSLSRRVLSVVVSIMLLASLLFFFGAIVYDMEASTSTSI